MNAHNASCSTVRVSSRRTTAESNMKVYIWLVKTLHNMHLACEVSPQHVFSFALNLVLFLPFWLRLYIDFLAFSFSVSPTVGSIQHSTPQNMYMYTAED